MQKNVFPKGTPKQCLGVEERSPINICDYESVCFSEKEWAFTFLPKYKKEKKGNITKTLIFF
jgi:hypothetical protein